MGCPYARTEKRKNSMAKVTYKTKIKLYTKLIALKERKIKLINLQIEMLNIGMTILEKFSYAKEANEYRDHLTKDVLNARKKLFKVCGDYIYLKNGKTEESKISNDLGLSRNYASMQLYRLRHGGLPIISGNEESI